MGCRGAVSVIAKAEGLGQSKTLASGAWLARGSRRLNGRLLKGVGIANSYAGCL